MLKKDFIALADTIRNSTVSFGSAQIEVLANFYQSQNPRFDRERWIGYIKGENSPSSGKR